MHMKLGTLQKCMVFETDLFIIKFQIVNIFLFFIDEKIV